ncbi:MAG TPA: polysaccharide biosynthesis/export family protein, partial [Chthoniobacteraceae bacterium]|nr:polysaccharide biosynthesis/export family protein [Chthoniobacteraceae bacterium]
GDKALGPGDIVTFEIAEDKTAPVKLRVSDTGYLAVPYIGNIPVAGKSCSEVASNVKGLLENKYKYYYVATVKIAIDVIAPVKPHPPMKVNVFGKVKAVGLIEIPFGEKLTLSEAISKAGGPTEYGDLRKVKFTRKGVVSIVDVQAIIQKGETDKDIELQDGDTIVVPAKLINFGDGPG